MAYWSQRLLEAVTRLLQPDISGTGAARHERTRPAARHERTVPLRGMSGEDGLVTPPGLDLRQVASRLGVEGLVPPVKAVELGAGGVLRIALSEELTGEQRARLAAALDGIRWKIV